MTDITIDDLMETADAARGASSDSSDSSSGGGGGGSSSGAADTTAEEQPSAGGEWLVDLYDRLEESGKLDRILFGDGEQREMDEIQAEQGRDGAQAEIPAPEDHDPNAPRTAVEPEQAADGGSAALEMDADRLKSLMLEIYDNSGMIPGVSDDPRLSELIKLVDSRPDVVNRLIEQRL